MEEIVVQEESQTRENVRDGSRGNTLRKANGLLRGNEQAHEARAAIGHGHPRQCVPHRGVKDALGHRSIKACPEHGRRATEVYTHVTSNRKPTSPLDDLRGRSTFVYALNRLGMNECSIEIWDGMHTFLTSGTSFVQYFSEKNQHSCISLKPHSLIKSIIGTNDLP